MTAITDLTALGTTPASGDLLVLHDISAGTDKKVTRSSLLGGVAFDGGNHNFGTSNITSLIAASANVGNISFTSGGLSVARAYKNTAVIAVPDIAAGATSDQTVTISGVLSADVVIANVTSALPAGLTYQAYVSAADTVTFRFANVTASTILAANYNAAMIVLG